MHFDGEVVVVTGGASGIGRATADLFAHRGARVVVADRNLEAAKETASRAPGEVSAVQVDVSDSEQVQRLLAGVMERYGRLDVLCNNAGFGFTGNVTEIPDDEWDRLFSVNVRGIFLCSKYALPYLSQSPAGNIVNITSYTTTTAIGNRAAYVASKGAISALTRAMAVDHAPDGVRVNAVAPGTVDSPYFAQMIADSPNPGELRRSLDERALLGRMGRPEEIAQAIVWLASSEASFATGSVLTIDGGSSIWGRN